MKIEELRKLLGKKILKTFSENWKKYYDNMVENDEVRIEWEKLSGLKLKDIDSIESYIEKIEKSEVLNFAFDFRDTKQGLQYWSNIDNSIKNKMYSGVS